MKIDTFLKIQILFGTNGYFLVHMGIFWYKLVTVCINGSFMNKSELIGTFFYKWFLSCRNSYFLVHWLLSNINVIFLCYKLVFLLKASALLYKHLLSNNSYYFLVQLCDLWSKQMLTTTHEYFLLIHNFNFCSK